MVIQSLLYFRCIHKIAKSNY